MCCKTCCKTCKRGELKKLKHIKALFDYLGKWWQITNSHRMSQGGEICFFDGVWAFSSVPAIARPNAWCATCAGKQTANWALGRAGHKTLPREQKRSCRLMFRMVVSRCLTVSHSICSIFAYVCTPSSYSIWGQSRITLYCHTVPPPLRASRSTSSHNFSFGFGQLIPDIPIIHSQLSLILPVIWYFR